MQRCFKQNEQCFFLPRDEADGSSLQGRDLSNLQMGVLPKSMLLHCKMIVKMRKALKVMTYGVKAL